MSLHTQEVDTRTAPEGLLREMHEYYIGLDAEFLPDDPPTAAEQRIANWRNIPERQMIPRWLLRHDGEIVAVAVAFMDKYEDLNNGFARIQVRPDRRRRGYARTLATPVFDRLEREDRKSLITDSPDGVPWESKLEELGLKKSFGDKRSRLWMADVDWDLMDRWTERASQRASDYHLLYLELPIPDEYLEKWCEVQHVMHTAPKEDLDFEFETWTPARWRDQEEKLGAAGDSMIAHVAVHTPTGDFVGLSDVFLQEHQPEIAWQGDTGVDPGHRNKGLGRWMKAATIKKVRDEHSRVDRLDTFNAGSNEAMLSINVEMGYKPILLTAAWQGDLAVVRQRLGA
jgi:mycothiol synthase